MKVFNPLLPTQCRYVVVRHRHAFSTFQTRDQPPGSAPQNLHARGASHVLARHATSGDRLRGAPRNPSPDWQARAQPSWSRNSTRTVPPAGRRTGWFGEPRRSGRMGSRSKSALSTCGTSRMPASDIDAAGDDLLTLCPADGACHYEYSTSSMSPMIRRGICVTHGAGT